MKSLQTVKLGQLTQEMRSYRHWTTTHVGEGNKAGQKTTGDISPWKTLRQLAPPGRKHKLWPKTSEVESHGGHAPKRVMTFKLSKSSQYGYDCDNDLTAVITGSIFGELIFTRMVSMCVFYACWRRQTTVHPGRVIVGQRFTTITTTRCVTNPVTTKVRCHCSTNKAIHITPTSNMNSIRRLLLHLTTQGPVVQKPVNANLGLKVNQGLCFSF